MTTTLTSPTAVRRPGHGDPRTLFARAVATGGDVIGGVRADQLADPTPCDDFDVRALLDHLLTVLRKVAAMGRGQGPFDVPPNGRIAEDGWLAAWYDAAQDVEAAWWATSTLARVVTLPWATLSGAGTLRVYLNEVTVHTWDLAVATGQTPAWDRDVLLVAFDAIRAGLPAGQRRDAPFADVVAVPAGAPLIDRLVAWNGRQPAR